MKFDVETDLVEQTVQGNALGGLLPSFIANPARLDIDIRSEVAKRGTGPAKAAYLKELSLSITPHAAPQGNFNFLDEAHLFVEGPGLEKKEIAKLQPVPRAMTKITFDLTPEVDLLPYINAGASISATAMGTQPTMTTKFDGHIVIEVRI